MPAQAKFVVQPFRYDGSRLIPAAQSVARSEAEAVHMAEGLAGTRPAVIAFEVENDEEADIYGEPRIFFRSGLAVDNEAA